MVLGLTGYTIVLRMGRYKKRIYDYARAICRRHSIRAEPAAIIVSRYDKGSALFNYFTYYFACLSYRCHVNSRIFYFVYKTSQAFYLCLGITNI